MTVALVDERLFFVLRTYLVLIDFNWQFYIQEFDVRKLIFKHSNALGNACMEIRIPTNARPCMQVHACPLDWKSNDVISPVTRCILFNSQLMQYKSFMNRSAFHLETCQYSIDDSILVQWPLLCWSRFLFYVNFQADIYQSGALCHVELVRAWDEIIRKKITTV